MGEPWCKSIDEIRRLTDWQIKHLLFLPALRKAAKAERRDGTGKRSRKRPYRQRDPRQMTKEDYFIVGEKLGCSRPMMEKQWADAQAEMAKDGHTEPRPGNRNRIPECAANGTR